uniref:NADH dehydrogenase subunit 4L n=1 Tax=Aporrectodea tuberculata TaxID=565146 RepID=UPI0021CC962E|nr:NADH dehydrogenase subunit 4L [Aporrectodea tuberculata]UWM94575.1 NADH dehydrogenase subunit 4L [Aporrectodea tuberculata]UWM94588.1 NADH dehydrogenase subunit 4L [Aporrectodea tuberculata]UWM94601.1 NADH dehydrogenase subunit 4L [Aporrectodea tuberculata]UWM94614.1 NADH dehydrogenase subunit 4L [Aporrectodea tuberculata]
MFNSIMALVFLLPLVAMLNLITNQSHFLMTLLSLEGITLSLVLFVPLSLSVANAPNTSISVMLLTFGACEASIGLSLMVLMSRSYGTDMLNSLTMNKC